MIRIDKNNKIKIYNDGILILEGETIVEIKELLEALLYGCILYLTCVPNFH